MSRTYQKNINKGMGAMGKNPSAKLNATRTTQTGETAPDKNCCHGVVMLLGMVQIHRTVPIMSD
ncbi:hypothetical protein [Aeromonas jandaei]|uniref:hypothetical protein n=1 Tax=Aeromonas jandaei TaxID=650 RepID=UPI0038B441FD